MKSIFKSALTLFLALSMLLMITACGNNGDNTGTNDDVSSDVESSQVEDTNNAEDTSSDSSATTSSTISTPTSSSSTRKSWSAVLKGMPSSLKGTTIEMYNWNPISEIAGAKATVEKFTKETGIKVKWTTESYGTYLSKLASRVAAKDSPDVVRLTTPLPGALISLQDLSATNFDYSDKAWDKTMMQLYTVNGKVYGTTMVGTHLNSERVLFYNKNLISEYELSDPFALWKQGKWNLNTFLQYCRAFTKEAGTPAWGFGDPSKYLCMFGHTGIIKFDGKQYSSNLTDNNFVKLVKEQADFINTEKIATSSWGYDEFEKGEALFWTSSTIYSRKANAYFPKMKSSGVLGVVPLPTVDGQKTYYQGIHEAEAYGVAKGAKNAAAVGYFLRYFLDPTNYSMSDFFYSKEAYEVWKSCSQQANKIYTYSFGGDYTLLGGRDKFEDQMMNVPGAQIPQKIQENAALINTRIKKYNEQIGQIK